MTAQPIETTTTSDIDADAIAATATGAILERPPLEGTMPMPADLIKLRAEKLRIDAKLEALEFRKQEIKDLFEDRLREVGKKSFTIHGKNKATVSEFPKDYVKPSVLKEKYPGVAADPEVFTTKAQVAVTIAK